MPDTVLPASSRAWRIAGRVLLVGVVALLPLELGAAKKFGEPYPVLFQPGFSSTPLVDGLLTKLAAEITVTFDDGTTETLRASELRIGGRFDPAIVFRSMFGGAKAARREANVGWLRDALLTTYPKRVAVSATIVWVLDRYSGDGASFVRSEPRYTIDVSFK